MEKDGQTLGKFPYHNVSSFSNKAPSQDEGVIDINHALPTQCTSEDGLHMELERKENLTVLDLWDHVLLCIISRRPVGVR